MLTDSPTKPQTLPAGQDLSYRSYGVRLQVSAAQTNGELTVLEHTLQPGFIPMPRHVQQREIVTLYVLEGQLSVEIDGRVETLRAGNSIVFPRGVARAFWNHSSASVRFLQASTPGGIERYYADVQRLIPTGVVPDVDAVLALSTKHGLEFDMESLLDLLAKYPIQLV